MSSDGRKTRLWLPAGPDLVPKAEFCPDVVSEYKSKSESRSSNELTLSLRKHLLFLGWKIEFLEYKGVLKFRYTSPSGKSCQSLREVCKNSTEVVSDISPISPEGDTENPGDGRNLLSTLVPGEEALASKEAPERSLSIGTVVFEAEFCPQALADYLLFEEKNGRNWLKNVNVAEMRLKARKHLTSVGWSFYYISKRGRREMRYVSPSKKKFNSLRTACKECVDGEGPYNEGSSLTRYQDIDAGEEALGALATKFSSHLNDIEFQGSWLSQNAFSDKQLTTSLTILQSRKVVKGKATRKLQKKRKHDVMHPFKEPQAKDKIADLQLLKKRKVSKDQLSDEMDAAISKNVRQSRKRARKLVVSSSSHHIPHTILSWLIDSNVVLPREKVYCRHKKDGCTLAEGRISREGIKCSCCQNIFSVDKFKAHASSNCHRTSKNIFLKDGRSLLECQSQLRQNNERVATSVVLRESKDKGDYKCSICHYGGYLLLCDRCPSAFHTECLGLKGVPDGCWFCPSCCCEICGQGRTAEKIKEGVFINCSHCEHQFHVGCLRQQGLVQLGIDPKGNWFCNKRCEQIYMGLRNLLGKQIPVGGDNLTWTLLKYMNSDACSGDPYDIEDLIENYSKLSVALGVMHECFEPVKEPLTGRDLVEDIVFSRCSVLSRLNFREFFTVFLERNDELITVATVRVHGDKVAELPLVSTCFKYRRMGMCRILINELEKRLIELGVEKLVLPAIPSMLNTWTNSFGFSVMTESERLSFLDHTFLNFQGTIMCLKCLTKSSL